MHRLCRLTFSIKMKSMLKFAAYHNLDDSVFSFQVKNIDKIAFCNTLYPALSGAELLLDRNYFQRI